MSRRSFIYLIIFFIGIIVLLLSYILYNYFSGQIVWKSVENMGVIEKHYIYFGQLDGLGKEDQADIAPPVVGVMIDNHPDAYPQSGISQAPIVYEVPVEGGITRFMAVYPGVNFSVNKVGPVRSARPYFLDWLAEYGDALYLHSGGSPEALSLIKERKIFDANEFWWGEYYWRDNDQDAPHNLFTSSSNWGAIIRETGAKHPLVAWQGWNYSDTLVVTNTQLVRGIKINYTSGYKVEWTWDTLKNSFTRAVNGSTSTFESEIVAQNIIVQYVNVRSIDEIDRKKITTVGSGEARVLRDGFLIRGSWKKEDLSSRTRFYDENNQEISLKPGITWVQIVSKDAVVEVTS
ncbi:MAG: DUF3048 domain-containing protein [Candidatus Magasanikbacteria bacterium]